MNDYDETCIKYLLLNKALKEIVSVTKGLEFNHASNPLGNITFVSIGFDLALLLSPWQDGYKTTRTGV